MPDVETFHATEIGHYSEGVSKYFVPLSATSTRADTFRGTIRSRGFDQVYVSEVRATSHQVERTWDMIADSRRNYLILNMLIGGECGLRLGEHSTHLRPGDISVYDTDAPYALDLDDDFHMMMLMFPTDAIDLPRQYIGQIGASRIAADESMARLVGPFLTTMSTNLDRLSGYTGMRLVHNAVDLVSTVLHSCLGTVAPDPQAAHRASLLRTTRAYIDDHLADPNLNPGEIAAAAFISTRHLHNIFGDEGVTVSTWIRQRRLENCRRDLSDPANAHLPVSAVIAAWGFVDASHFSRLFKSTYGQTPTEYRLSPGSTPRRAAADPLRETAAAI